MRVEPMPKAELDQCMAVAADWAKGGRDVPVRGGGGGDGGAGADDGPIFLVYASHLAGSRWYLGLTAALYNAQLVIAGLGEGARAPHADDSEQSPPPPPIMAMKQVNNTPQGRRRTTAGGGITARRRSCPACAARCRRDGGSRIDQHAWRSACRTLGIPSYFFHPCAGARSRVPFASNRAYRCVRHCHRKPPRHRVRAIAGNSPAYSRDTTRSQTHAWGLSGGSLDTGAPRQRDHPRRRRVQLMARLLSQRLPERFGGRPLPQNISRDLLSERWGADRQGGAFASIHRRRGVTSRSRSRSPAPMPLCEFCEHLGGILARLSE